MNAAWQALNPQSTTAPTDREVLWTWERMLVMTMQEWPRNYYALWAGLQELENKRGQDGRLDRRA